jgi:hypothetical protein
MTTADWIAVASIATVIVSATAIVAALKGVRDQLKVTIFLTYTDRYTRTMNGLPFEARRPDSKFSLASLSDEERTRVLGVFREYFNLCSEESWLHRHHRIDHATWEVWERGMQQVARFPCFREVWKILSVEYEYFDKFREFVDDKLLPCASPYEIPHPANSGDSSAQIPTQGPTTQPSL